MVIRTIIFHVTIDRGIESTNGEGEEEGAVYYARGEFGKGSGEKVLRRTETVAITYSAPFPETAPYVGLVLDPVWPLRRRKPLG
ncbi:MAG: hypothetical protein AB2401_11175 [Bacillus sp. (in: firmicutes)]